jgi:hypothetical protein
MAGASLTERSVGVAWFLPLWTVQDRKFVVLSSWNVYGFSMFRKVLGACLWVGNPCSRVRIDAESLCNEHRQRVKCAAPYYKKE